MIAIIAGCGSNISSVLFALKRLGKEATLTTDPVVIQKASHVILPGVGYAQYAMQQLINANLITTIQNLKQPVLGICLGMQLLFQHSAEGNVDCLGIIPDNIFAMQKKTGITIPHMGWNRLSWTKGFNEHPLLTNIQQGDYVYFVHSFAAPINAFTIAHCEHGQQFSAIVQNNNFYAMQFHPERSGVVGEKLLANFLTI